MAQSFIGEIRMFGGNFAPAGWATCDGQLLSIADYDALFNLIGTTFGGDGQQTFALPNLAARLPVCAGTGTNLGTYTLGQAGGVTSVTLNTGQLPVHGHPFLASDSDQQGQSSPTNAVVGSPTNPTFYSPHPAVATMSGSSILPSGGNQPHGNMMPYLAVTFIISLYGVYPTQS